MITWGREYWTWFLLNVSLQFLVAEIYALFTNAANTLSDYSRYELGLRLLPGQPVHHTLAWTLSLVAWWLFVGVITWHIWFVTNAIQTTG
jgi:hypothetical protein